MERGKGGGDQNLIPHLVFKKSVRRGRERRLIDGNFFLQCGVSVCWVCVWVCVCVSVSVCECLGCRSFSSFTYSNRNRKRLILFNSVFLLLSLSLFHCRSASNLLTVETIDACCDQLKDHYDARSDVVVVVVVGGSWGLRKLTSKKDGERNLNRNLVYSIFFLAKLSNRFFTC